MNSTLRKVKCNLIQLDWLLEQLAPFITEGIVRLDDSNSNLKINNCSQPRKELLAFGHILKVIRNQITLIENISRNTVVFERHWNNLFTATKTAIKAGKWLRLWIDCVQDEAPGWRRIWDL